MGNPARENSILGEKRLAFVGVFLFKFEKFNPSVTLVEESIIHLFDLYYLFSLYLIYI